MNNEVIAMDPFGKTVYLLPEVLFVKDEALEIYDNAVTVIEKPALVVEVLGDSSSEFYYLRSIGWNRTLLITARLKNERWEAYEYLENPSSAFVSSILKRGKQVF